MRLTWLIVAAIFLGALFLPWLAIFGVFALIVALAGALTQNRRR